MQGLTYFAAIIALFAAMIFAQQSPTSAPSEQSNSGQSAAQSQNVSGDSASSQPPQDTNQSRMHDRAPDATVPDNTIRDQQQTPNPLASPRSPQPQAYLMHTPAARAAVTHTPDPGTCMNPAALEPAQAGTRPHPGPPCD